MAKRAMIMSTTSTYVNQNTPLRLKAAGLSEALSVAFPGVFVFLALLTAQVMSVATDAMSGPQNKHAKMRTIPSISLFYRLKRDVLQ